MSKTGKAATRKPNGRMSLAMLPPILLVALAPLLAGCVDPQGGPDRIVFDQQDHIGTAYMRRDRTIILDLRAQDPYESVHGHGQAVYKPGHPSYKDILIHLDGISPGETKPVRPWLDP